MSLFQGLEIGKRALIAHQLSLNTAGHNISNVNTPGFTRQRVQVEQADPLQTMNGPVGLGVNIMQIERVRDLFLTNRWREENMNLGQWKSKAKHLVQLEGFVNEPQDSSLGAILNDFWAAWQDLANKPEAPEGRKAVIQQAHLVTNAFHQMHNQMTQLGQSVDNDIQGRIREVNNLGSGIAVLNEQIKTMELGTDKANDLRDRRDQLVDTLSEYVNINTREDALGNMTVSIGGMAFVDGGDYWALQTDIVKSGEGTKADIMWKGTSFKLDFFNGEMKAMIETRDETLPDYLEQLNTLSRSIIGNVNAAHRNGYGFDGSTGLNFFDPIFTSANQISVSTHIEADPNLIAASLSGEVGDGSNARTIADVLKTDRIMNGGTATIDEYYGSMVGSIGIQVREAEDQTENYTLLVQQIENARQSVQGVSLDEEMANMVKYQQAYAAAARVITFMDEALTTLISGTGVTGR